jgi:DNA polymerase-1
MKSVALPAGLPDPGAPNVLYIVDLHCWMHRFFATVQGRAAHCFLDFIGNILRFQQPSHFAVCRDMPHPTFRHDLAPKRGGEGYKATREPPDPTLLERLRWAREMLEDVYGIPVYAAKGYEADDLIAALTKQAKAAGMKVVLLALDKDLMQLVDDQCVMWDGKRNVVGPAEVEKKFGVRTDQLRDYLAIVGDVSDNVPGVKGMGPKAAVELLSEFGSLANALQCASGEYGYAGSLFKRNPRYQNMLVEQVEGALLSQKLIQLAFDAPVTFNERDLAR